MIQKKVRLMLAALLAVVMALCLWGFTAQAFAAESVDPRAPFYNNPYTPDCSTVVKNEDGSFSVTQNYGGGNARLFYGDYTSGGAENAYFMDLTDATISLSVDELAAGVGAEIYFVSYVANGSYPMQGAGQGFSLRLTDDGSNNTGFVPVVHTYSMNSAFINKAYEGNQYLVYNNASPRTSYLGKELKIHIFTEGDVLNVHADWVRDDVNAETAYDFRAQIPLAELPAEGGTPFDYKNAQFGISNNGGNDTMKLNVKDISDAKNDAYYQTYGGKYKNSIAYTQKYAEAVANFSKDATTAQQVKDFYSAKMNFEGMNANGLRKNDVYEYQQAVTLSTEGFAEASLAVKDKVFANYDAESEITDKEDAIAVFAFYAEFSEQLSEYAAAAEHIRAVLAQEDMGQKAVETKISELTAKYAGGEIKRENYYAALDEYRAVVKQYDALSAFVRALVGNYDALQEWADSSLAEMKDLYYSTAGSYFTNEWGVRGEEDEKTISKSYAAALRADDGSTKLILSDDTALRLVYGTDIAEGTWSDYAVDLSDFEMTFSVDKIAESGRFAVNFVSERSALPFGEETDPGLSIMFRMGFGGGNTIGVALTETKGGVYPNKNTAPDHPGFEGLDEWGGFGILSNPSGVLGKNITLKLQKAEEGVSLTLALEGGNTVSVGLSAQYLGYLFRTDDGNVDTSKLVLNFTTGEGMTSFNGGQDMELTVKTIKDEYFRNVNSLYAQFDSYKKLTESLSVKESLTFNEISAYNAEKQSIDALSKDLRTHEAAKYAEMSATLDASKLAAVDALAAAYMRSSLESLKNVTVENVAETETKFAALFTQWEKFSAAQKALYDTFDADADAIRADIAGCKTAISLTEEISALIAQDPLPTNIETLRANYAALREKYDALAAEYREHIANREQFLAYGEALNAYDPAQFVSNAIEKLFTDFETITSSNKAAAKAAVQSVKDAYEVLTDAEKEAVTNFAKIARFEYMIAAFEQEQIDFAKASAFDKNAKSKTEFFATIDEENRSAAIEAVESLKADYEKLTDAQKALVKNYALVEALENSVKAFDEDAAASAAAQAVIDQINAIGEITDTKECKAKIDAARTSYDALDGAAKAKVTNLSVLEKAEKDYAAFAEAEENKGCGSAIYAGSALSLVVLVCAAVAIVRKKVR